MTGQRTAADIQEQRRIWESRCPALLAERDKYHAALTEIRMLTVEVGDSVEAATKASWIALEALGE